MTKKKPNRTRTKSLRFDVHPHELAILDALVADEGYNNRSEYLREVLMNHPHPHARHQTPQPSPTNPQETDHA